MKRWMITAVVLLGMVSSARAVDVVFSTDNAVPQPAGQNPVIYANVGDWVDLWLLARRSGDEGFVRNLSLSVRAQGEDGGAITGPGVSVDNPYQYIGGDPSRATSYVFRWDTRLNGTPEAGGLAERDSTGLSSSYRSGLSIEEDWSVFGSFDFQVAHEGTVRFYMQVGSYGILEGGGSEAVMSRFGWASGGGGELDAAVANGAGAESGYWDAMVIAPMPPLPEPGVVGVVGLAGVVLAGGRWRR